MIRLFRIFQEGDLEQECQFGRCTATVLIRENWVLSIRDIVVQQVMLSAIELLQRKRHNRKSKRCVKP